MTDQVYYKIQYPLKKAIGIIKSIDRDNTLPDNYTIHDLEKINEFIEAWEDEGRVNLREFIDNLKGKN